MAQERLSLLNAALAELGEEQLYFADARASADFDVAGRALLADPEDDLQVRCAAIYPQVRAKLLNAYPWSWLSELRQLTSPPPLDTDSPDTWPYRHRYHVPQPLVGSVRAVWDGSPTEGLGTGQNPGGRRPRVDGWTIQGRYLFADFSPAWARFQLEVSEEAWPKLFDNAMVLELAARLSMSIKEDMPTTRYYHQQAEMALADAKRVDAQGRPSKQVRQFDWEQARYGGHGGNFGTGIRVQDGGGQTREQTQAAQRAAVGLTE